MNMNEMNKKVAKLVVYSDRPSICCKTDIRMIGYYDVDDKCKSIHEIGCPLRSLENGENTIDDLVKCVMDKGFDEVIVPKDMMVK